MVSAKFVAIAVAAIAGLMGISLVLASSIETLSQPSGASPSYAVEDTVSGGSTLTPTENISGSSRIADSIATYFVSHPVSVTSGLSSTIALSVTNDLSATADYILSLKASGMGWGEIVKAFFWASSSGESVEAILDMRSSGMGWGEIKNELGAAVGKGQNLGAIMSSAAKANKSKTADDDEIDSGGTLTTTVTGPNTGKPNKSGPSSLGKNNNGNQGNGRGNSGNAPGRNK